MFKKLLFLGAASLVKAGEDAGGDAAAYPSAAALQTEHDKLITALATAQTDFDTANAPVLEATKTLEAAKTALKTCTDKKKEADDAKKALKDDAKQADKDAADAEIAKYKCKEVEEKAQTDAQTALDKATTDAKLTPLQKAVTDAETAITSATNAGLSAGTFAAVQAHLQAGELLFVLSDVSGALAKSYHEAFSTKLDDQITKWGALETEDTAAQGSNSDDTKKEAWTNRVDSDKAAKQAVTDFKKFIDAQVTAMDADDFVYPDADFNVKLHQYFFDLDTQTLAQVKTAVVLDEANKDKYDAVVKILEPETESQKKNLEQASKDKAKADKGGSNTGMIVGIVLSVLAVVVIGGVVYKCSQKEEEEPAKDE